MVQIDEFTCFDYIINYEKIYEETLRKIKETDPYRYKRFNNFVIKSRYLRILASILAINLELSLNGCPLVVDIGCGIGLLPYLLVYLSVDLNKLHLRKFNTTNTMFIGLELDISHARCWKKLLSSNTMENAKLQFIVADARHLPFRRNVVSLYVLIGVIEHIKNPCEVLMEIVRTLCSNGYVYIDYLPAYMSWEHIVSLLMQFFGLPTHEKFYKLVDVFKLINNFEELKIVNIERKYPLPSLIPTILKISPYKVAKIEKKLLKIPLLKCVGSNAYAIILKKSSKK